MITMLSHVSNTSSMACDAGVDASCLLQSGCPCRLWCSRRASFGPDGVWPRLLEPASRRKDRDLCLVIRKRIAQATFLWRGWQNWSQRPSSAGFGFSRMRGEIFVLLCLFARNSNAQVDCKCSFAVRGGTCGGRHNCILPQCT